MPPEHNRLLAASAACRSFAAAALALVRLGVVKLAVMTLAVSSRAVSTFAVSTLVVATFALPVSAAAAAFDLDALMKTLAAVRAGEATFVERREVAVLDRTVTSSGRLSFEAPDTFVRETLAPSRDRLAVSGNTLTMSRGDRARTMALDAVPEAAVIVEAIRGTLTGNGDALARHFETTVGGTPERWTLALVPRDARLRGQVASVRVSGEQAMVREVDVRLADGDRSVMTIEPSKAVVAKPADASGAAAPDATAPERAAAGGAARARAASAPR